MSIDSMRRSIESIRVDDLWTADQCCERRVPSSAHLFPEVRNRVYSLRDPDAAVFSAGPTKEESSGGGRKRRSNIVTVAPSIGVPSIDCST